MQETTEEEIQYALKNYVKCPDCEGRLFPACGCWICQSCGYTECDQ
jgi:hypothetical protein